MRLHQIRHQAPEWQSQIQTVRQDSQCNTAIRVRCCAEVCLHEVEFGIAGAGESEAIHQFCEGVHGLLALVFETDQSQCSALQAHGRYLVQQGVLSAMGDPDFIRLNIGHGLQ